MSELKKGSEIKITDDFTLVFNRADGDKSYCVEKGCSTPLLFVGLDVEKEGKNYKIQHIL